MLAISIAHYEACADTGHAWCGAEDICADMAQRASSALARADEASSFDAGQLTLRFERQMPDESWPTVALFAVAERLLVAQPNIDGAFRTIAATTALARLAERGFDADWVLREQFGPSLLRTIILASVGVWNRMRIGEIAWQQVPELHGWLRLIADEVPDEYTPEKDLPRLITTCLAGDTYAQGSEWLMEASTSDIVAWRLGDHFSSPPLQEDMRRAGGRTARRWLAERFTRTYLHDWSPESLDWETAFLENPRAVSHRVGIPASTLEERAVTGDQISAATSMHVLEALGEVLPGMDKGELLDRSLRLLETRKLKEAVALSRAALDTRPSDEDLRALNAFCEIPTDPSRSLRTILELDSPRWMGTAVRAVNVICCRSLDVKSAQVETGIAALDLSLPGSEDRAWLWDLRTLRTDPHVIFASPSEWASLARRP